MSKKKQYLYNGMWGNKNFDFPVSETKVSAESTSCNSYSFEGASTKSEELFFWANAENVTNIPSTKMMIFFICLLIKKFQFKPPIVF